MMGMFRAFFISDGFSQPLPPANAILAGIAILLAVCGLSVVPTCASS